MGFKIVEYYIRNVLSDGIARLRNNPMLLDDVFGELMLPPLGNLYGKKIVDEIKAFFTQNDIPVLSAYNPNQIQLPSITVHLISSMEDPEYRSMQDHWDYVRLPTKAAILAGPVYGESYDPDTGELTFSSDLDLSQWTQNRKVFAKRDDTVYTIHGTQSLSNAPGSTQYITLLDCDGNIPESIDFAELYLLSGVDFKLFRQAAVHFRETFEIRVNAETNTDQAVWLYYIVAYILMRNKAAFENVGLESQTFSTSEFTRDAAKAVNTMWGRTLRFSFLVQHTWAEEVNVLEIVGINVNSESNITDSIGS